MFAPSDTHVHSRVAGKNVIDENGLEHYDGKLITKSIVNIIQPRKLKNLILDDIDFRGKERFQTRKALYGLVMHHANNLNFYYGSSSKPGPGFSSSRFEGGSNSKTGLQCFFCKGNQRYNHTFSSN